MSRDVARAAAQWLALLESGAATERDHVALQHWRDSHPQHEQTWQKAQSLRQRFSGLPQALAMASLDRPQPGRRAVLKRALGVAALVPATWLLSRQLPIDVWRADLHTATGERKRLPLANGASLQLNTATAVDVIERRIRLVEGELALNVPGTAAMTVQTRYGELKVSQAEVCVRQFASGCRVSVLKGVVEVRDLNGQLATLQGGQQASLKAGGLGQWVPFDVLQLGWREGVLAAQNQPLGDFLRELERYRPGVLRWDPRLEGLRVTGSFRLDDTDRILNLLASTLGFEVHARTRYWVTLS